MYLKINHEGILGRVRDDFIRNDQSQYSNAVRTSRYLTKVGDKYVNTGVWRQYDNEGKVSLKVKYENGLRTETVAYQDNRVIKVYRKD